MSLPMHRRLAVSVVYFFINMQFTCFPMSGFRHVRRTHPRCPRHFARFTRGLQPNRGNILCQD